MRNPKIVLHGSVLFITASVEADLVFPPNPLTELLLTKCLASAQQLYPLRICHFLIEATHIHLLVIVDNPDDIKDFMCHFKRESAHCINRLLGREKRTVWCEGYDSPVVDSAAVAIDKVAYLYTNPAKDSLVDSIDHYPGLSSWDHFKDKRSNFNTYFIPRDSFRALPKEHTFNSYLKEARLLKKKKKRATFYTFANAWMDPFGIEANQQAEINRQIIEQVYSLEDEHRTLRARENRKVLGVKRLIETAIGTPYLPKRTGKRMICLGASKEERAPFIAYAKAHFQHGREVYEEWKRGNTTVPYPLGLYPPAMPKLANAVGGME